MGSPTHFYVDPTVASDGGDGSLASPWTRADGQVEQYAMDTGTLDTTHGVQINIKSGTRHTTLNATRWSSGWSPQPHYHITFRGYTSSANDGGRADLDWGGTSSTVFSPNENYCEFIDCDLKDWANGTTTPSAYTLFTNCSFESSISSSSGVIAASPTTSATTYVNCRFDLTNANNGSDNSCGITLSAGRLIGCYVKTDARTAVRFNNSNGFISDCVINHDCADANGIGIFLDTRGCVVNNTSIYNRGTKFGTAFYNNSDYTHYIRKCYAENFTNMFESNAHEHMFGWFHNYYYNCTNLFANADYAPRHQIGNTQLLLQSAFNDAAGGDLTAVTDDEQDIYLGDPDGGSLNRHYFTPGALGASAAGGGGGSGKKYTSGPGGLC